MVSKMKSWTAQPNSGRIGRSPGAVPRISADRLLDVGHAVGQRQHAALVGLEREGEPGSDQVSHRVAHPRLIIGPLTVTPLGPIWIEDPPHLIVTDCVPSIVMLPMSALTLMSPCWLSIV